MDLSGSHILNTTPDRIWAMLMDTDILARIVPGVTTLEKIGDNEYKAIAQVKMGPVNGSFSGGLTMQDIREGEGYTLNVKQSSKIGNADATVKIDLKPIEDGKTELVFDGGAKLSGLLARTGNRSSDYSLIIKSLHRLAFNFVPLPLTLSPVDLPILDL